MKIGNKPSQNLPNVEANKGKGIDGIRSSGLKTVTGSQSEELSDTAKINLSDRAQAMQKAKEIASQNSVNESRVAQLQKLIDEGNYRVDSKDVADRLVDEHLNMTEER